MPNAGQLERRLTDLIGYIRQLAPIEQKEFEDYQKDYFVHHTAEHLIELIVECGIDINKALMDANRLPPSPDYRSTYLELGNLKILSKELSRELAGYVTLRNQIAHEYERLTHRQVYDAIPKLLAAFKAYASAIQNHLEKLAGEKQKKRRRRPKKASS